MFAFLFTLFYVLPAKALTSAQLRPPPLRVVFVGGAWVSGSWAKEDEIVAGRFKFYLEKYLGRDVELKSIFISNVANIPNKIRSVLAATPADYVFYFCDHSSIPISLASQKYVPWKTKGHKFTDHLARQIGALRLSAAMTKSENPEDVLLQPLSEVMRQSSEVAHRFGAKFIMLWPSFAIVPLSWDVPVPNQWPVRLTDYLDYFKSKPLVSPERMNYYFRKNDLPFIPNLQIRNYFSEIRKTANANARAMIWSTQASDRVAEMLATSVVSLEF